MTTLNAVLREILEARGFMVDQSGPFVHGRREGIELHFFPYSRHSPAAMEEFARSAPSLKGKVVLAALVPLAESVLVGLPKGVVVWDREAVEHEVGRTRENLAYLRAKAQRMGHLLSPETLQEEAR